MFEPSLEACARSYEAGQACLVSARLAGDLETPVSAFLKLSAGRAGRIFLLESVEGGAARGRYSMIGLDPDIVWRVFGGKGRDQSPRARRSRRFFALRRASARGSARTHRRIADRDPGRSPPMAAGVFGYLGYDMVRQMERLAEAKPDPIGVPDALMLRPTVMVVFDAVRDEIFVVTPLRPDRNSAFRAAHDSALERLESVVATLEGPLRRRPMPATRLWPPVRRARTRQKSAFSRWSSAPRITSGRATFFRSSFRSGFRRPSRCPPLRSTGRCGGSTPRRFSAISILDRSRSSVRARKSWCARGAEKSPSGRSRDTLARQDEGRGRTSGGGAFGRRKGMRRAFDAARSRPQRCRARRRKQARSR